MTCDLCGRTADMRHWVSVDNGRIKWLVCCGCLHTMSRRHAVVAAARREGGQS